MGLQQRARLTRSACKIVVETNAIDGAQHGAHLVEADQDLALGLEARVEAQDKKPVGLAAAQRDEIHCSTKHCSTEDDRAQDAEAVG